MRWDSSPAKLKRKYGVVSESAGDSRVLTFVYEELEKTIGISNCSHQSVWKAIARSHSRGQHFFPFSIFEQRRKRLHTKRVQLPEDSFGTPTWPPFHCFGTPIWPPRRKVIKFHREYWLPFVATYFYPSLRHIWLHFVAAVPSSISSNLIFNTFYRH